MLQGYDESDDFITCGTENSSDSQRNLAGLVKGHAYTVLGTARLSNGKRLVKIRNPWGQELFKGAYGEKSKLWNEATKREAGHKGENDGIYFTDIESYVNLFSETSINIDVEQWASAKFLKLDDTSQKENPGIMSECGE